MSHFIRTGINGNDPITNTAYVSKLNKIKVLNLIRNRQSMTRPEVAKEIGLSLPTVNRLVDSLISQDGLVKEIGKNATNLGRPAKLIEFAGSDHYVIGLSIGNTYISGVLTDLNAQIICEHQVSTSANHNFSHIIKRTAKLINGLIERSGVPEDQVLGVGIGVGGLIDVQRNLVAYSAAFDWRDKDLAGELGQLIDMPIIFDHNARVMSLGELWFGIGDRIPNFICVLLGYRIGAAFIMDRSPFFGWQGMTGEFGHCTIDPESTVQCTCGNYGCLEALASGYGIAETAKQGIGNHPKSILHKLCDGDLENLSAEHVAEAANQGDEYAQGILNNAAHYIGIGLSTMINLYNPQAIVLGGGLINAGDDFLDQIHEVTMSRALKRLSKNVVFQKAAMGQKTKKMGAVALILNEVLNLNIMPTPRLQVNKS